MKVVSIFLAVFICFSIACGMFLFVDAVFNLLKRFFTSETFKRFVKKYDLW